VKHDVWLQSQSAPVDGELPRAAAEPRSPLLDAKVMLVDDEPLMTALVEAHLEEAGYTNFVTTNDPREALAMLRREEPGVVLLDLMMPQLSGFDVLAAIRADAALGYTPVIVLTAAAGADAKLRALQLGATDFLSKPVDASELVLRVRNSLAFQQFTQRLMNRDQVTDLPNARPFLRFVDQLLGCGDSLPQPGALFSIEVPQLRDVAETLGQAAADEMARTLALRLSRIVESGTTASARPFAPGHTSEAVVARLEVDRFGLVVRGLLDADSLEAEARRVIARLAEPVVLGLHEVVPAVWLGVAAFGTDGNDAQTLRRSAERAASHARQTGGGALAYASKELNARTLERMTLGAQLRGAAARGELRLHYQPKINLADGRISGAEALVRWEHPQHGLLPPGRFIALAEELGLITAIGTWVAEQACQDAARWVAAGHDLTVAINASKPQFLAGDLCEVLRCALFDAGLPPERLVVELTESMLMDDVEHGMRLMHRLKALGLTLSIDDFGTGYSSLSYLKNFPLDELKIDRSFVMDLPGSAADLAIVRSVVDLGHNLGMSVIAEGVETDAQRACLLALGCDRYQGFLFSRPVPLPEFERLLVSKNQIDANLNE